MDNEKVVSFEEKKEEKVEEGMSELKKQFVEHLQRARGQGIAIGSKTIAFTIMSMASNIKDESNIEEYKAAIDNILGICQKTTKLSVQDFIEQKELVETIIGSTVNVVDDEKAEASESESQESPESA